MSRFWSGKKVVVTGGCGMIGSRLAEFLRDADANVLIIDDCSRGAVYLPDIATYADTPYVDVGDVKTCEHHFEDAFAVFNLAASVGGVYFNLNHQASQFHENMRLLTAPALVAAEMEIPIFLQTSSVCIYAVGYNTPALEENGFLGEPEGANAGYAWAKRMGERVCSWAFAGTSTKCVVARPTNAYGLRDYYDDKAHVIPALIRKCFEQDVMKVYGGPQTREFIYADDVARGMMALAEKGVHLEAYNLGTNSDTQVTISYLAKTIHRLVGRSNGFEFVETMPTGDEHRCTNSLKAQFSGWKHRIGLEKGLERVIEAYRDTNFT